MLALVVSGARWATCKTRLSLDSDLKNGHPAKSARLKFGLLSCILGSMADEKVLTPEEQKVADVKAAATSPLRAKS